ncbi:MAG: glycosyltransferase, partial [Opitutaceae bacterium]|nr:glycosyltransferase [Opitutaceae bacterium]
RVVATAQVPTTLSWRDEPRPIGTTTAPITAQFFNPHFDVRRADYTLRNQGERAPPCWHLDTPPPTAVSDGCVYWRGWCFSPARGPLTVRVTIPGHFTWPAANGLDRPDVHALHPTIGSAAVGFELRLRLPTGKYEFNFEAVAADGTVWPLFQQTTRVSVWPRVRYFLLGSLEKLLPFQLIAAPSQCPRPLPVVKIPSCSARPSPRLAIVTPSFQQAKFLEQTMRSVLEQSGIDCAYVVQDGGSADGSRAIIERLAAETGDVPLLVATSPAFVLGSGASSVAKPRQKSSEQGSQTTQPSTFNLQLSTSGAPRLVAWESASDAGQADAIKRGFAKTSGGPDDVMAWINSDDFYLPGALAYVVDYFARHPDVEVIYGHRIVVDENSQEIGRWFLPQHDPEVLRLNDFVPQETMFWRRRLWDRVGGIDASFKFAMDWDLLLRFQAAGARMVRVPYFLACFRVHAAQKTSAQIQSIGQAEINHLRERAQGRVIAPEELGKNSRLLRYLRRSALIELMTKIGRGSARR